MKTAAAHNAELTDYELAAATGTVWPPVQPPHYVVGYSRSVSLTVSNTCPRCHRPYYTVTDWGTTAPAVCQCLPEPLPAARVAWECPRCHVIHAPHVDRCECTP